jgi:outer membrane protein TolC
MQRPAQPFLALLILTASGCASYRAAPLDAATELRALRERTLDQLKVERAAPGQKPSPSDAVFDPSDGLDEAEIVAVALTLNPELRARRAEIGEAKAMLITAGLWPNPEIGVSPKWGIDGASGVRLDADALLQLLRPGERDARQQSAHARVDEVQAEVIAEEFRLAKEVRSQRLNVLAAERSMALWQRVVGLREDALDLVRRQRKIGEGTELDISATDLEAAQARRDLRKSKATFATERRKLNQLMGLPPGYDLRLAALGQPPTIIVYDDISDDELDRLVLAGRPELHAGEAAYKRSEQEFRLAVIQQYPRLGVGPGFERELGGDKSLGLSLSLELPAFNQNQGEIAEKRAARDRAHGQYVALLHRLVAEAFDARAELRTARLEMDVQEREILPLLNRNEKLFEGARKARELNVIDWITAQQRAVEAQREYAGALVRYQQAVIEMETATGQPLSRATTRPTTNPS